MDLSQVKLPQTPKNEIVLMNGSQLQRNDGGQRNTLCEQMYRYLEEVGMAKLDWGEQGSESLIQKSKSDEISGK